MPNVQAIIVTWNKKRDVMRLLENLQEMDYPKQHLSIAVVDNHSTDGTVQAIEKTHPRVTLIKNRENRGGAGGFNAGMRWALENRPDADYLWLLDNDVLLDSNALKALVAVMEKHPRAGICGSKIMDMDNPHEMIEVGAFIDYRSGHVHRNEPPQEELRDHEAVFEVDYVAACSLLARTRLVREMGLWHEKFFIYWDDMEWGARFNAAGHKVLASNGSVVYHPSWAGRVADSSAIWRNYYRTRNSLWFYNNYCTGFRRRMLLARMVTQITGIALHTCLAYETALSHAFLRGMRDFFADHYGKKDFFMPFERIETHLSCKDRSVCVFIPDSMTAETGKRFVRHLMGRYPNMKVSAILPKKDEHKWKTLCDKDDRIAYTRLKNGRISWSQKYRLMKFLKNQPWEVLLTSHDVPRMGAIWGKDIAQVDFGRGASMASIEHMDIRHLCLMPVAGLSFLLQALFCPPRKERIQAVFE